MGIILRSIRNLLRSPLRTSSMVVLLAVSIGLALIMATVHGATQNQLGSIGTQIGTEITISSVQMVNIQDPGSMLSVKPLAQRDVDKLRDMPHVASVQAIVDTIYRGSSLKAAAGGESPGGSGIGSVEMPIYVQGFDAAAKVPKLPGGADMTIVEGRYFTRDENNANVMVMGKDLADKNSLKVGDKVDIEGTSVEVIGIYDSGTVFGDNMLVMPIGTVERLYKLDGPTLVTVQADHVSNVDKVVDSIREVFPKNVADVVSTKDMYGSIDASVVNADRTSFIGMIVAFVVAGVVVLFSVLLMVRQRVKEIGILKAIGASAWRIGLQFSLETFAVSVLGAIIGASITYPLAQKVSNLMVGGSSPGSGATPITSVTGGVSGDVFSTVGGSVAGLHVPVSPTVFLYALAIAAALAVLASALPAWYIARVKPAEVLRNE